jgi:hypothetical protein
MILPALLSLLSLQTPGLASKITLVEGFEKGTNTGNWSFFGDPANSVEQLESSGGNPGRFLHATCAGLDCLDTFAPQLRTQLGVASFFTGDYRAKGVIQLGVDLAIFGPPGVTTGGRPLSLVLRNDAGTPLDSSDDPTVFFVGGRNIPDADGEWDRYSFRLPSASTTLPPGWQVLQGSGNDDADWNQVITDVDQVEYFFGDPNFFFIFQQWELGVDNLRIRLNQTELR